MRHWIFFLAALPAVAQPEVPPDPAAGRKIFESQCSICHGQTGEGARGPSLQRVTLPKAPDDAALRRVIGNGIEPEMPAAWLLNPYEVASVALYVRSLGTVKPEPVTGDPVRGKAVYDRTGCAGCHIVSGQGKGYGPELTDIGARRSAAFLKQTLLNPAGSLPEGFLEVTVVTGAGEAVRCLRVNEDSFTIQCRDRAGQFHSFRKSELKSLERLSGRTPMPSFARLSTAADLDDLVAYLAALRGKS